MFGLTEYQMNQLRTWARTHVRTGYMSVEEMEETMQIQADAFETETCEREIRHEARSAIIDAIDTLVAEQKLWPLLTDVDRLDLAFEQLDDAGIIARQSFSDCSDHAGHEITAEVFDYYDLNRDVRGFVYFHEEATTDALETGILYLSFGSVDDADFESDREVLAIGGEVTERLKAVGLDVRWDARAGGAIAVHLNWQKRWDRPVPSPLKRSPF